MTKHLATCGIAAMLLAMLAPIATPHHAHIASVTITAHINQPQPQPTTTTPVTTTTTSTTTTTTIEHSTLAAASRSFSRHPASTHQGFATWWQCVGAVENSSSYDRSSNPTHFGRYQMSMGVWTRFGGSKDTWGTAGPAEQDRVFAAAVAANDQADWVPFDHC